MRVCVCVRALVWGLGVGLLFCNYSPSCVGPFSPTLKGCCDSWQRRLLVFIEGNRCWAAWNGAVMCRGMEGALLTLLSLGSYSRLNVGHVEPITPFTILLQRPPLLGVSVPLHGLELNLTNPFTRPPLFLSSLSPSLETFWLWHFQLLSSLSLCLIPVAVLINTSVSINQLFLQGCTVFNQKLLSLKKYINTKISMWLFILPPEEAVLCRTGRCLSMHHQNIYTHTHTHTRVR